MFEVLEYGFLYLKCACADMNTYILNIYTFFHSAKFFFNVIKCQCITQKCASNDIMELTDLVINKFQSSVKSINNLIMYNYGHSIYMY